MNYSVAMTKKELKRSIYACTGCGMLGFLFSPSTDESEEADAVAEEAQEFKPLQESPDSELPALCLPAR